jgi:hypothetical protein
MLVLNVFSSTRRMKAHLSLLENSFPGGSSFMLFKSIEETSRGTPEAMARHLLLEPWLRVGAGPATIGAPT